LFCFGGVSGGFEVGCRCQSVTTFTWCLLTAQFCWVDTIWWGIMVGTRSWIIVRNGMIFQRLRSW
jgi:hypothetical protein